MKIKKILFGLLSIVCSGFSVFTITSCGHEHEWSEIKRTTATCTGDGKVTYLCVDCEETKDVVIEEAKGHTEVIDEAVDPTCTETGLTKGKHCSECNETLVTQEIVPSLEHNYQVSEHLEATCENEGYTTYVCSNDSTHTYTDTYKAAGHTEVIDAAVEATCTTTGLTEGKHCSVCNDVIVLQEVVAALGHTEVTDAAVEATCTETGLTQGKHCSVCNEVLVAQLDVDALGHDWSYICEECGQINENYYTNGLEFTLSEDGGSYYVSEYTGFEINVFIPSIYDNKPVTSIGSWAFYYCSSLTSITIPESVTSIGQSAFNGCSSLTSITIPESVTSIGDCAFEVCRSLTSIVVDKNNTVYDSRNNCNAIIETCTNSLIFGCKNTIIPNSVTSIGDRTFYGCRSLTSITIPESVTSIGVNAFLGCDSLTSIVVDKNNTVYDSRNNCNAIIETCTDSLIFGCKNTIIPNSVTSIGSWAFSYCESLTSIVIPDSVTSIGDNAFFGSSLLTSIIIGNSVESIGSWAFFNCSSLTTVYYTGTEEQWNNITIGSDNSKLTSATIYCLDTYTEGLVFTFTEDGESYSVSGYTGFNTHVIIPFIYKNKPVTSIGANAFEGKSIPSITIPDSITSIGNYAFLQCNALTSIVIPDSVTSIGNYAFDDCDSLTSVTIGNGVTSIGYRAFFYCRSLTSVTIGSSVTSIGNHSFYGCESLISIKIPDGVTYIGVQAFDECDSLTSIILPDSVTTIDQKAFYSNALKTVYYIGTEEQWNNIVFWTGNNNLTHATIIYNYIPE